MIEVFTPGIFLPENDMTLSHRLEEGLGYYAVFHRQKQPPVFQLAAGDVHRIL